MLGRDPEYWAPSGGFVGELRLGAGSVWVLSHREYTDETRVEGASLLRIDPSTSAVVATPVREELSHLGGDMIYPVTVDDDAIWFIGSTGRTSTLGRLDPRTLEQTLVTELPISAVRAARDPSTHSFWIASWSPATTNAPRSSACRCADRRAHRHRSRPESLAPDRRGQLSQEREAPDRKPPATPP